MISDVAGLLLYLWVALGFTVIALSLLIGVVQPRILPALSRFSVPARSRVLWFLVISPFIAGAYVALLTLVPSLSHEMGFSIDHCVIHSESRGHLCWYHPPTFAWISWQGFSALAFALFAGWKMLVTLAQGIQHYHHSQNLLAFADKQADGTYRIESEIPNAFTLGLFTPKVVVSNALANALNPSELAIVERHEVAHQRNRDPLRLWLFSLLLSIFTSSVRRNFYKVMELTVEQAADAAVAQQDIDPKLIAQTLVKVNRLTTRFFNANRSSVKDQAICYFGTTDIEQRVQQLLNNNAGHAFPMPIFLTGIFGMVLLSLVGVNVFHHLIESLLYAA
ncbi:MAG: hypothetical protein EOO68_13880 [Moraxellaceae bacterium]|nr:MAG: hypothetical protein EOO68_13880 [Moraxellaceae bacterium]